MIDEYIDLIVAVIETAHRDAYGTPLVCAPSHIDATRMDAVKFLEYMGIANEIQAREITRYRTTM